MFIVLLQCFISSWFTDLLFLKVVEMVLKMVLIQFNLMKNIDDKVFIADKPGWMNITNFILHHRIFAKSSAHNV